MDEMTQHNAALVEETNAAIEQTEAQAVELDRIVEVFVVDASAHRPSRNEPTHAAASQRVSRPPRPGPGRPREPTLAKATPRSNRSGASSRSGFTTAARPPD